MRILVYGISNQKGGISEFMMGINQELIQNDLSFDYIIKGQDSIYEEKIKKFGGKVFYYNYTNFINRITNIYKIIKDNRKDHKIFYYNNSGVYFIFPLLFAYLFGYKIISHAHSGGIQDLKLIYRILNRVNGLFLNFASKLKFQCSKIAGEWVFGKAKDVIQINNTIDIERFSYNETMRATKRKELGIKDDEIVLISVGRVEYPKNQKFLIDMINNLNRESSKKYTLFLVGPGDDIAPLKAYAKSLELNNVNFLGSRNDVSELLNAADIFLLPSFYEGFPIVSVEAQASGLTCILSDKITDEANITGLVTYLPIDDPKIWADHVEAIKVSKRKKYDDVLISRGFSKEYINNTILNYINSLK